MIMIENAGQRCYMALQRGRGCNWRRCPTAGARGERAPSALCILVAASGVNSLHQAATTTGTWSGSQLRLGLKYQGEHKPGAAGPRTRTPRGALGEAVTGPHGGPRRSVTRPRAQGGSRHAAMQGRPSAPQPSKAVTVASKGRAGGGSPEVERLEDSDVSAVCEARTFLPPEWATESEQTKMTFDQYASRIPLMSSRRDETPVWD